MKKIAIQMLADSLGLSRVTVWKVLNNKPGVSPSTAKRVLDAIEEPPQAPPPHNINRPEKRQTITLLASRVDTSSFWMSIVEKIISELNASNIDLEYLPINAMGLSDSELSKILSHTDTSGFIVLNVYNKETIQTISSIDLPKVFYDTVPGMNCKELRADLCLLEGKDITCEITQSLIDKGCKTLGFIGDIDYAKTNMLRWEGFCKALQKNSIPQDDSYCFINMPDKIEYIDSIKDFLDSLETLPDALVCVSDHIAFTVMRILSAKNIHVPNDILLAGYDDQKEYMLSQNKVTTVHVRNALLGKRIVLQMLYRLDNPDADFEEVLISPDIVYP